RAVTSAYSTSTNHPFPSTSRITRKILSPSLKPHLPGRRYWAGGRRPRCVSSIAPVSGDPGRHRTYVLYSSNGARRLSRGHLQDGAEPSAERGAGAVSLDGESLSRLRTQLPLLLREGVPLISRSR